MLKELGFNYCFLDQTYLENLLPGLCKNINIERLNFSCNGLDDRSAYLIAKIINAQSERRDEIVWSYSLRGELPPDAEYKRGLKEMMLSHNNFGAQLCHELIMSLRNDIYVRSLDLRNNSLPEHWLKQFVKLLLSNKSLTQLDLRENEGFNEKIKFQISFKLLQNI